jgi:hypothetical protein
LEIIGIAYVDGAPLERFEKVNRVRQGRNIEYRLLLGGDRNKCPVKTQFGIRQLPALVLLDASGKISWRGDLDQIEELDNIIRVSLRDR